MESIAPAKVRIIDGAIAAAKSSGLADLTVAEAARAAGVSSALVHYHFDTKQALIVAVADRVAAAEREALSQVLAKGRGLETIDHLWDLVTARARGGDGGLRAELAARAGREPAVAAAEGRREGASRAALAARLPSLVRELGTALAVPVEEAAAALSAFVDGLTIVLIAGVPAQDVRTAYDAFWLTLIAAGQGVRRR